MGGPGFLMIVVSDQFHFLQTRDMSINPMNHNQWVIQVKEWLQLLDEKVMTTDDVRRAILDYQKQCEEQSKLFNIMKKVAEPYQGEGC